LRNTTKSFYLYVNPFGVSKLMTTKLLGKSSPFWDSSPYVKTWRIIVGSQWSKFVRKVNKAFGKFTDEMEQNFFTFSVFS
jgi:hypothetical protein